MKRKETCVVHAGRKPGEQFGAVNTPVYRASTILFPDTQTMLSQDQPYIYGRHGVPTTRHLEEAICELEGGAVTVLTPSGLSACNLAILTVCGAGDHLLVTDSCYGPTRHFCETLAKRYGIETTFFDPHIGADVAGQFRETTRAVFVESPGSHTFEVQDVPAIAAAAKKRGIAVIMDNTWATPLYFAAIGHGVDLSVQAGTKYLGGHADVNLGTVTSGAEYKDQLVETHSTLGLTSNGDEAYLAARGLRTLAVRLKRHEETATELAEWLSHRPEVARVLYPALPGDPGHTLWKRDFTGASGLFGVILKPVSQAAVAAMLDGFELFGLGYSWGGYESLAVPSRFHRSHKFAAEGPLVRFHAGLEDVDDLKADLAAGLERLSKTT